MSVDWLLLFFVHFCFTAKSDPSRYQKKPLFVKTPEDSYPLRRKQLSLRCQATGFPIPEVTWYKDGEVVQTQRDKPGTSNRITRNWELFFLSFSEEDEGLYYCNASNSLGWIVSPPAVVKTAHLSTEKAVGPESKIVSLGDPVLLECVPPTGLPKPSVSWLRGDKAVALDSRVTITETGDLKIVAATQLDSGTYQCSANNIAGNWRSRIAQLTVQPRPRFRLTPGNKQIFVGGNVEFQCSAPDDPNSTILWRRDGGEVPRSSFLNKKSLRIEDVHLSDAGNYVCEVKGSSGKVEAIAHLSVISPPSFVITPDDREVSVGEDVFFDCLTSGTPAPTVRWIYKEKTLWVPSHFQRPLEDDRLLVFPNGTLLVRSASVTDEGVYECKASQLARIVKSSAYLSIKFSSFFSLPLIELGPQNQTLQVGTIATLPCHSTVVRYPFREGPLVHSLSSASKFPPELSVDWLINGIRASSFNDPRIVSFHSGSLQINAVRMTDAGIYTCRAEVDDFSFPHTSRSTMWSAVLSVSETYMNELSVISTSNEHQPSPLPPPPDKVSVVEIGDTWILLEVTYLRNVTTTAVVNVLQPIISPGPLGLRVEMAEYNRSSSWQIVIPFAVIPRIKVNNLKPKTGYFFVVRSVKAGKVGRPVLLERLVYTTDPMSTFTGDPAILSARLQFVHFSSIQLRSISPSEILAEFNLCGPKDSLSVVTGFRTTVRAVPLANCLKPDAEFGYTIIDKSHRPGTLEGLCSDLTESPDPYFVVHDQLPHCSITESPTNVVFDRIPPQFLNREHFENFPSLKLQAPSTLKFVLDGLRPFLCYSLEFEAMATHANSSRFFSKKSPSFSVLTYDSPPAGAPKVILARWLQNGTVLDISWQPPVEWEQGGFITGYTLWVLSASSSFNQNFRIGPEQLSFLIRDLDAWTNYTIYLAAENCRGEGIRSQPIHVFAHSPNSIAKLVSPSIPPDGVQQLAHRQIVYDGREVVFGTSAHRHFDAATLVMHASESPEEESLTSEPWFIIAVIAFVLLWILIVLGLVLCGRYRNRHQRRQMEIENLDVPTKNGRLLSATDLYPIHSWPSGIPHEAHPLVSNFDSSMYSDKSMVANGCPSLMVQANGLLPGITFGPQSIDNGSTQATVVTGYPYNPQHSIGPQGTAYVTSCNIPVNGLQVGLSCFQPLGSSACIADSHTTVLPQSVSVSPNGHVLTRYDHTSPKSSSRSDSNPDDAVTPYASVPVMQQMLFFDRHTTSFGAASGDRCGANGRQLSLAEIIPPPPDYPPPSLPSGSPVPPATPPEHQKHWTPTCESGSGEDSAYYAHSELQPSVSRQTNQCQQHRIPAHWSCTPPASDEISSLLPHSVPPHRSSQHALTRNNTESQVAGFG